MYEETCASDLICQKLDQWEIQYERGVAVTGVVTTIKCRNIKSGRTIAFRADLDASDILEESGQPWASQNPGKMYATLCCKGHLEYKDRIDDYGAGSKRWQECVRQYLT